ncbi:MAG TPA: PucR family transcriptional regulator ligand-binding domain-containing protein [Bacillus sp. (in: firmicutes)]|nr:PucR family transcriptional regulator ligand-binding domain-containing protein [Bacillus sp. (in: firmicutes)]
MICTMKNILGLEEMKSAKVLTAEHTLSERSVELVSVIEAPVDLFDRKKEFVLTTGIGCHHDPALLKSFVKDVIDSEAEALGIATGNYILDIPEDILHLAGQHEFPIIQIPWEVRFGHIIQAVLGEIHKGHQALLKQSEEMQTRLLQLFLTGAKFSDALQVINENIRNAVAIIDYQGKIKGKSSECSRLIDRWNQYMQFLPKPLTVQLSQYFSNIDSKHLTLEDHSISLIPIQSANEIQGYLLIGLHDETSIESFPSKEEEKLLEYAASSLALWFQREYSALEIETRLRGDFVWNLAKGNVDSWDMVYSQAKSLGYDITLPYVCILGLPENLNHIIQQQNLNQTLYENLMQKTILSIEEQIAKGGEALHQKTLITFWEETFIIYLEVSPHDMKNGVHAFLDLVEEKLQNSLPGIEISWGISEYHGIKTFHESYNDARAALNIGRRQKQPGQRFTFNSVGLFRALLSLVDNPDMQKLTLSTIGVLIDYDSQRNSNLFQTLSTYIRNQGNMSQTARDLFIHRQSLLYRLQKIAALTGLSVDNHDDFLTLSLGLKLWYMGIDEKNSHLTKIK